MRRSRFPLRAATLWLAAVLVALPAPASSQQARGTQEVAPAPSDSGPRILDVDDYGRWKRIASTGLSPDGRWLTYAYNPNEGDDTLFVRALDSDEVYTIPVGSAPSFADDSGWVGYFVSPPEKPAGERAGRAGGGAASAPTPRRFELLNVATGERWTAPNAKAFAFSDDSRYVAVHLEKSSRSDTTHSGTDLLVRDLASGSVRNIGNVSQYDFAPDGALLAYLVDAANDLGNGVYLVGLAGGETRALDAAAADYDGLAWSDEGTNLAAIRGTKPEDMKQKANVLLTWTGLGAQSGRAMTFDPTRAADFPAGYVLSEFATPRWSRDGTQVLVGIKEQEAEPPKDDEDQANVDIWHWADAEVQSVQIVRLRQALRQTLAATVRVPSGRFVQLADSAMATVQMAPDGSWGIGRDDVAYRGEVAWGGSHADYYRVDAETGGRSLIAKELWRTMGMSPDSRFFLYLQEGQIQAYDATSGVSRQVDGGMDFVNRDDDHDYELPIWGLAGWSSDGRSVLVYDKFDVWKLSLDGTGAPVNLTEGVGAAQQTRLRVVRLDLPGGRGRFGFGGGSDSEDDGIDLTQPLTLSAYGVWDKKSGYWTLEPGKAPRPLLYDDAMIGQLSKAKDADRVVFTRQTFEEFPDLWTSTTALSAPRKVTEANPFLGEYAWGSKVLVDYTNSKGQRLQGTLTLPADYVPGQRYPMIVYFYEIVSNTHHQFSIPAYDDRPQMSTYASNGYLVFQPDVVYEIGRPGSSALDCVTSGVNKVIELGYADPAHIGLQGHSWGGYQSSFILTQTDMFAAVVTGAPVTNLISFYGETYPGSGTLQQGIMEVGQVRMGENVTPWNSHDLYEEQSPVFNVPNISTPFMILHGTEDTAVDWHQGLELYAAARRNGKKVILLSYPGEPHHLTKRPNQIDFQIRMKQFFDHYLMGAPATDWMEHGLPQVRKGAPVRAPTGP